MVAMRVEHRDRSKAHCALESVAPVVITSSRSRTLLRPSASIAWNLPCMLAILSCRLRFSDLAALAFFERLRARQTRHAREALCDERHVVEPAPAPRFGRRGNVGNGLAPLSSRRGLTTSARKRASTSASRCSPLSLYVFTQKGRSSFVAEAAHAGGDVGELAFGYGIATVALQASPGRAAARAGTVVVDELQAPRASRA